ncbi:MAG: LPS export ABC transporter permease LptG [Deltaproteobacteria bacterium]|nr:LPS export ABC transporter permease LptG [Candidatus Anaeroferrophillus wilburensis]MBN2887717.1 LPS export ABC transporter permease LptG [Deltaproteobacteria bacterium]
MKLLDRYLIRNFLQSFVIVAAILLFLFSFFELMAQMDTIGTGHYTLRHAFQYTMLTLPKRLIELLPVSTLLGSIIGLGLLANHDELLALQAAGLARRRICLPVLTTGLLLMLGAGLLAEFVVPPLEQQARTQRLLALSDTGIALTQRGFWVRHGHSFIRVGKTSFRETATDLDIYTYNQDGRLQSFLHSPRATITEDQRWLLENIEQKQFTADGVITRTIPSQTMELFLNAEQLTVLRLPPDSLSPSHLFRYIRTLRERGQNADHYLLALWQKMAIPLTTGAMILLSLPLMFGSNRTISAGWRIMVGILVGILSYLANEIIGDLGLLFNLHPSITVLLPIILILGISGWLAKRTS